MQVVAQVARFGAAFGDQIAEHGEQLGAVGGFYGKGGNNFNAHGIYSVGGWERVCVFRLPWRQGIGQPEKAKRSLHARGVSNNRARLCPFQQGGAQIRQPRAAGRRHAHGNGLPCMVFQAACVLFRLGQQINLVVYDNLRDFIGFDFR